MFDVGYCRQSKLAAVVLLGTGGRIPPHSKTYMESECTVTEKKTIYPFAYRTHTHSLGWSVIDRLILRLLNFIVGKVVAGYKVHRDENGEDHWTLLGKRDPLTPQMFYPTFTKEPITYGDKLAARCTMISNRDTETKVGSAYAAFFD